MTKRAVVTLKLSHPTGEEYREVGRFVLDGSTLYRIDGKAKREATENEKAAFLVSLNGIGLLEWWNEIEPLNISKRHLS